MTIIMTSEEARIKSEQKLCKALSFMFSSVNDMAKMSMIWNIIVDFFEMVHIFIFKKDATITLKSPLIFLR